MPNALDVELAVVASLHIRKNLVVPNVSWGLLHGQEADLLVVYPSNWMHEIEIKVTSQDIKADKGKRKWVIGWQDPRIHQFWFAVPEALQDHPDIPEHAGIYTVWDRNEHALKKLKNHMAWLKNNGHQVPFENGYSRDEYYRLFMMTYHYSSCYMLESEVRAAFSGDPWYCARVHRFPKKIKGARKITDEERSQLERLLTLRVWSVKKHLALEKQKTQRLKKRIKELECQAKPN